MKLTWPSQRMKGRTMVAIPLAVSAVLLVAILIFGVPLGRDFKGGTLVMVRGVENAPDVNNVKSQTESLTGLVVDVKGTHNGFDIETDTLSGNSENQIKDMLLTRFGLAESSITIGALGPTVSSAQILEIIFVAAGALIVIWVVILIFRRRVAATTAVITAGLDVLGILGLMALFRVPLNLASIIGILITFCFVIETNVLLAYRLLKGAVGDPKENAGEAMKAGLAMSVVALSVLLSINILTTASLINELTLALVFGIIVNIVNTWFLGVVFFMRHVERKKVVSYHVSI
ncbi:MAG: hypothetical protein ABH852_00030 [Methanobacteriota archaeon]